EKVREVPAAHEWVNAVCYRPDGQEMASTGPDGVVRLGDPDGTLLDTLIVPEAARAAARPVATGAALWGMGPASAVGALLAKGNPGAMLDLANSPDGRQLAGACEDGRIYFWDTATRKLVHRLEGHARWVRKLAYASAERVFSCGVDGTI